MTQEEWEHLLREGDHEAINAALKKHNFESQHRHEILRPCGEWIEKEVEGQKLYVCSHCGYAWQDDLYHLMNGRFCGEAWDAMVKQPGTEKSASGDAAMLRLMRMESGRRKSCAIFSGRGISVLFNYIKKPHKANTN